jgi:hypothetical protein
MVLGFVPIFLDQAVICQALTCMHRRLCICTTLSHYDSTFAKCSVLKCKPLFRIDGDAGLSARMTATEL